ncbi:Hypothetical predicted protein, partial [Podarcis lilfordi]
VDKSLLHMLQVTYSTKPEIVLQQQEAPLAKVVLQVKNSFRLSKDLQNKLSLGQSVKICSLSKEIKKQQVHEAKHSHSSLNFAMQLCIRVTCTEMHIFGQNFIKRGNANKQAYEEEFTLKCCQVEWMLIDVPYFLLYKTRFFPPKKCVLWS